MKKILLGLLVLMTTFASCIDQEEIEIAYQSEMSVTASHIFDGYTTVLGDEFNMKGTSNGNWDVNLHAFIYDKDGLLVKKVEEKYSSLSSTMSFALDLLPGTYSIVSIAEFSGTFAGNSYRFWNISNEENLKDLSIVESSTVCNSPFETLGITAKEFEIGNSAEHINIDIQPVTGLLQTIIWDDDLTTTGTDGFSYAAPYINDLTIFASDLKQVVKFNGSIVPTYDYGDQATRYPIMTHSPKNQFDRNGSKQSLGFRALLPQENRDFYWELNTIPGAGKNLFSDGKDFQMSDYTDNKPNIESGKQYVMDLILDQFYLYVDNYDPNVDMFERLEGYIKLYNKNLIKKALSERYDKYVGMSRSSIETYLKKESLYTTEIATLYLGSGLIQYITSRYTDSTHKECNRIVLTWGISTDEQVKVVTEVLSEMYTPWEKGTTENIKQFINASTINEATVGITWDTQGKSLYFDAIK